MQIANSRPPWENSALAREEMSLVICNRSAAFYAAGDYLSSLLDAEAVIAIRRPWSKGHYRKARALAALGDWQGAHEAIQLGLQFEPNNTVRIPSLTARVGSLRTDKTGSGIGFGYICQGDPNRIG
jgi:translocation protein SEC72